MKYFFIGLIAQALLGSNLVAGELSSLGGTVHCEDEYSVRLLCFNKDSKTNECVEFA